MKRAIAFILCAWVTTSHAQFSGSFILNTTDTQSLQSLLQDMSLQGVDGAVKIFLESGNYYLNESLDEIPGASEENYIQIKPLHPENNDVILTANVELSTDFLTLQNLIISDNGAGNANFNGLNFSNCANFSAHHCTFMHEDTNAYESILNLSDNSVSLQFDSCIFHLAGTTEGGISMGYEPIELPIYFTGCTFFEGGRIEGAGYYSDCTFECGDWNMFTYDVSSSTMCIQEFSSQFVILYMNHNTFNGAEAFATLSPQFSIADGNVFNVTLDLSYANQFQFLNNIVTKSASYAFCSYNIIDGNTFYDSFNFVSCDNSVVANNIFLGQYTDLFGAEMRIANNCFSGTVSIDSYGGSVYFNNFSAESTLNEYADEIAYNNIYDSQFLSWDFSNAHDNNYFKPTYSEAQLSAIANDPHPHFFDPMYETVFEKILTTNFELSGKATTAGTNVNTDINGHARYYHSTIGANELCFDNDIPDTLHLSCTEGLQLTPCNPAGFHFEPSTFFDGFFLRFEELQPFQDTTIYLYFDDVIIDSTHILVDGSPVASMSVVNTIGLVAQFENLSTCGETYQWSFGDGQFDNTFSPTHTYPLPGEYEIVLIVYNAFGSDTTSTIITVTVSGLNEKTSSANLFVSPNPCVNTISVQVPSGMHSLLIYAASGELVRTQNMNAGKHEIDLEHLEPGIYVVQCIGMFSSTQSVRIIVLPD